MTHFDLRSNVILEFLLLVCIVLIGLHPPPPADQGSNAVIYIYAHPLFKKTVEENGFLCSSFLRRTRRGFPWVVQCPARTLYGSGGKMMLMMVVMMYLPLLRASLAEE